MINAILGAQVDLIEPFPVSQIANAVTWFRCYKTTMFGDDGPQSDSDIESFLRVRLPLCRSWAVVDKDNLTQSKRSEVPLVGLIVFERGTLYNGYGHIIASRRAWGDKLAQPGLIEQAARLALETVFADTPELQRISLTTFAKNSAAKALALRLGFHKDGYFKAMGRELGKPQDVVHFGLTRAEPALTKEASA